MGTGKVHWLQKEGGVFPVGLPGWQRGMCHGATESRTGRGSEPVRAPTPGVRVVLGSPFPTSTWEAGEGSPSSASPGYWRDVIGGILFPGQHFVGNVAGVHLAPSTFGARDSGPT